MAVILTGLLLIPRRLSGARAEGEGKCDDRYTDDDLERMVRYSQQLPDEPDDEKEATP